MENELFDNDYVMKSKETLALIKSYLKDNFPFFSLTQEYNEKKGQLGFKIFLSRS